MTPELTNENHFINHHTKNNLSGTLNEDLMDLLRQSNLPLESIKVGDFAEPPHRKQHG